jgi:spartin
MSASIDSARAQGFLLLTIPQCVLSTPSTAPQTGTLALQCVTLDIPSESMPDRDVWLVLKLNAFEMALSPTQTINYNRSTHTYMFLPETENSGLVQLVVPPNPSNLASYQDLETMEVILSQYGIVHDMEGPVMEKGKGGGELSDTKSGPGVIGGTGPSDFKGRLVLMDEDDGEVVATLDEAVPIKEDKSLAAVGHEKEPVVINLPGEEDEKAGRREAYAHPASPEEQDMMMKTAGLIR